MRVGLFIAALFAVSPLNAGVDSNVWINVELGSDLSALKIETSPDLRFLSGAPELLKLLSWRSELKAYELRPKGHSGTIELSATSVRSQSIICSAPHHLIVILNRKTLSFGCRLRLGEYLAGVVGSEMPSGWPIEALKAQAIVARTYALWTMQRNLENPFHIRSDERDQVFRPLTGDRFRRLKQAITATQDQVVMFSGRLEPTYYHAVCGGHTTTSARVWSRGFSGQDSVSCPYCQGAPKYQWVVTRSMGEISRRMGVPLCGVEVADRDLSGRVRRIRFLGVEEESIISCDEFRSRLGYTELRSCRFEMSTDPHRDTVEIRGRGFGHGVGLCQWGAYRLAQSDHSYSEILAYYYPMGQLTRTDGKFLQGFLASAQP